MDSLSEKKIIIGDENDGARLDAAISALCEDLSRNYVQRLIEDEKVYVNGELCTSKKVRLKKNDIVNITIPAAEPLEVNAENIALNIVYEDGDVLVVNKSRGMVVHPGAGNFTGTLVNALMYHCRDSLSSINGVARPGIVHRIDKDTSGLLMVAKNDTAHRSLAAQLAEHSIKRIYTALVYNNFTEDEGVIDRPVGRDPNNRLRQKVLDHGGRNAYTTYRVLERFGKYTLVNAILKTGRTHQIRVHMAYIKHPLVGDTVYGPQKQLFGVEGQMLHAGTIGFVHPITGEHMEFSCPLPDDFQSVLNKLRR